ncbi:septum formation initiator family protein [Candidatus Babeliales bacterium]|nr:septum formation initiator family protein [Candidatus Babeliales bacterium]MBP9843746.1 septum formation initiator family protein [Candidatus Babeliales bacterium]
MRYVWSRFIVMVLAIEGAGFVLYYNFGPRGIQKLQELQNIKVATQADIIKIQQENDSLKEQIEEWKTDLFLQEKFAREKLAMQKENETIYFIKN